MKSVDRELRKHIPYYGKMKKAAPQIGEKKRTGSRRKTAVAFVVFI